MEENKVERPVMGQEEFGKYMADNSGLKTFEAVSKFKSVNRVIRRGHVTPWGVIMPRRPFNNKANSSNRKGVHSRKTNELKKQIYGQFKEYQRRTA